MRTNKRNQAKNKFKARLKKGGDERNMEKISIWNILRKVSPCCARAQYAIQKIMSRAHPKLVKGVLLGQGKETFCETLTF